MHPAIQQLDYEREIKRIPWNDDRSVAVHSDAIMHLPPLFTFANTPATLFIIKLISFNRLFSVSFPYNPLLCIIVRFGYRTILCIHFIAITIFTPYLMLLFFRSAHHARIFSSGPINLTYFIMQIRRWKRGKKVNSIEHAIGHFPLKFPLGVSGSPSPLLFLFTFHVGRGQCIIFE